MCIKCIMIGIMLQRKFYELTPEQQKEFVAQEHMFAIEEDIFRTLTKILKLINIEEQKAMPSLDVFTKQIEETRRIQ